MKKLTLIFFTLFLAACATPQTSHVQPTSISRVSPTVPLANPTQGTDIPILATATEMPPSPTTAQLANPTRGMDISGVAQLTWCNPQCLAPAWLPDGTQISYFSGEDGRIHVVDLQGKAIRTFTLPSDSFFGAWSPDGKWMAFTTSGDKKNDLIVMTANGNSQNIIFSDQATFSNIHWSLDGAFLYCTLEYDDLSSKIIKIGADGSGLEQIATFPRGAMGLVLSPDGKQVVYVTLSNNGRAEGLRLLEIGKSKSRVLVDRAVGSFAWSPDGQKIAFVTDFPDSEIYVINPDGTGLTKLTEHVGFADRDPVWSPDGACLAFDANTVTADGYAADDQVYVVCNLGL